MKRSLHELELGLKGDLTMSDVMERLSDALALDQVPATWAKLACPSLRTLAMWLVDLQGRLQQLQDWTSNPLEIPPTTWLPGIFNPQSFLTAVMQVTARKNEWPLDKLGTVVDVTKKGPEEIEGATRDGAYIHGLFVEGARWDTSTGSLEEAYMKELYPKMPIILMRSILAEKEDTRGIYRCPVYKQTERATPGTATPGSDADRCRRCTSDRPHSPDASVEKCVDVYYNPTPYYHTQGHHTEGKLYSKTYWRRGKAILHTEARWNRDHTGRRFRCSNAFAAWLST